MKNVFILLALLVSFFAQAAEPFPAKVVAITDGDTIKVLTSKKELIKIRLSEIDTPERKQPWGSRAKQALSDLAFDKAVTVIPVVKDRYGRLVAHIQVDGISVSHELVRNGNAWVYRRYMKDESLLDLEANAKKMKLGLWGLPQAEQTPPWKWRRK